jgi:SAM-dependent methyltransferase
LRTLIVRNQLFLPHMQKNTAAPAQAQLNTFLQQLSTGIENNQLIKITLGNRRNKAADVKNVFIKPVLIKNNLRLSFIYRYTSKDVTKNYDVKESLMLIEKMLQADFFNADVFTTEKDFHLSAGKNETLKLIARPASLSQKEDNLLHDKKKTRIIAASQNIYLEELGLTNAAGAVKKDMQDKYKQINRYIEIIEGIIKEVQLPDNFTVADMGSGKGYLTFALYDYLHNTLKKQVYATGTELRNDLVEKCNSIAAKAGFANLYFKQGSIEESALPSIDMLIALHACDTATDEAIYKGIHANAAVIICAPCCHKQIRKQMMPDNALQSITRHGILLERQAEMVTDAIRALILEAFGYKTKVFDFIATEHTPKNVMIAATKRTKDITSKEVYLEKIKALKAMFNIRQHQLEKLMGI